MQQNTLLILKIFHICNYIHIYNIHIHIHIHIHIYTIIEVSKQIKVHYIEYLSIWYLLAVCHNYQTVKGALLALTVPYGYY